MTTQLAADKPPHWRTQLGSYAALLRQYLHGQSIQLALLSISILVGIGLQLASPQITRRFIDDAIAGEPLAVLLQLAFLFVGITIAVQLLSIVNTFLSETVAWRATNALRVDMLYHVLRLDPSFHKRHTSGELLERIDGDVTALATFFSRFVILVVANLLLMIGILVLLLRESWVIGISISVLTLGGLALLIWIRGLAVPWWRKVREQQAEVLGWVGEVLGAFEDIRSNAASQYIMHRFDQFMVKIFPPIMAASLRSAWLWPSDIIIYAMRTVAIFIVGAWFWSEGMITIGGIYLLVYYSDLLARPLSELRNQIEVLQKAEASVARINELRATTSRLSENGDSEARFPAGPLAVQADALHFGYDDVTVLHDINFTLPAGRVLGVLGRTGSGKSTLARLLLRLYDRDAGSLTLADVPIDAVPLDHVRQRVGMVTQDVQLFRASVRNNLTFFNDGLDDATIEAALAKVGLLAWVRGLPAGLDTELDADNGLSAGEAQLLALARIFLTDPGLIIMDEASSRLDPATEAWLEQGIDALLENRTAVIIAHRLSTVRRADDILILSDGRILEYGARQTLANDPNSQFAQLLRTGLEEVMA